MMQIASLDFETEYRTGYELRGLMEYPDGVKRRATMEAYIRGEHFSPICCCITWQDGRQWKATKPQIPEMLREANLVGNICLAHHAAFDGLILSHCYGIRPAFFLDTYSLASGILGNHTKVGLEALAREFQLPEKNVPYNLFKGRRFEELDLYTLNRILDGCLHDTSLTLQLFYKLMEYYRDLAGRDFPQAELDLIDMTIRWFTEPELLGDMELLADIWREEQQNKDDALERLGITADDVRSDTKLIELFEELGVEVAYKTTAKGNIKPCFAATDEWLREMQDDDDPDVSGLAEARVAVKSNAVQSRSETLGWMASRGALCVYTRYAGAHTKRWAGGDGSNFQNNKRGHRIRSALLADVAHLFAAPDASQIECRLLNTCAGQWDVVERFRTGADPYLPSASAVYGRAITKADVAERGTGKQIELSCGYMAGARTFQRTAAKGTYGPPIKITLEFAEQCVGIYRSTHTAITDRVKGYWAQAGRMLNSIYGREEVQWGPLHIHNGMVWLEGMYIDYRTLEWHMDEESGEPHWRLLTRRGWVKMYSGKLVENVIQFMARMKIAEDMLEIQRAGLRVKGMSHDEPWVLIPKGPTQDQALEFCRQTMARPVKWLPECPFAAEAIMAQRYPK